MSIINIEDIQLEIIGNLVYLTLPSKYTLTVNQSKPSQYHHTGSNPIRLSQRDCVEASGNNFHNK